MPAPANESLGCKHGMQSYGVGDGAKLLCGVEHLKRSAVLNIGSRRDVSFDVIITQKTPHDVHIFDCTVDRCAVKWSFRGDWPPSQRTDRVRYHRICLGASEDMHSDAGLRADWNQSAGTKFVFLTYQTILSYLRLNSVAALKMDIEGAPSHGVEPRHCRVAPLSALCGTPLHLTFTSLRFTLSEAK